MFKSYAELFRIPGARAFTSTGLIARLPISQVGIATLLLVVAQSGSYALAGRVSAATTLAGAIVMPQIAKQVDRRGQAKVARPVILVGTTAWLLLSLAVTQDWPVWTWYAGAIVGGASGASVGAMVRARWVYALGGDKALQQRAFSWESSLDEVVFVIGPPLATFLATSITPYAGLVTAALLMLVGGWLFTAQRRTEPPPAAHGSKIPTRALATPALLCVGLVFVCAGTVFGSIDVNVVAFTDEQGSKAMAGVVLGTYALGSLVAGLSYGVIKFKRSIGAQFVVAACLLGLLAPLLLLASNILVLAILIFVSGFAIAPLLISATVLIERMVPPAALTEGLTWSITALISGVTLGAALAGGLVDQHGAQFAFWLTAGAAILAAVVAVLASPLLRHAAVSRTADRLHASAIDSVVPGSAVGEIDDSRATQSDR